MSRSGDRTSTFDPSHSDNLLHGLNLLWRKQLFCDVTLTAQGQQFHCHKAVLASCSQYFRSLFSSGGGSGGHPHALGLGPGAQDGLGGPPKEPPPPQPQEEPGTPSSSPEDKLLASPRAINNLVLQGCSSIGLRLVLEYLYTANVTLSLDTVEEVLSVSKILHIPQVTKLCVQFLNDQISVQNYKQVCKIAALHGLEETKKLANKYLVEDVLLLNFEEMRALLDSLPPPRRVGAGALPDVRALAGARPGDPHAVRPGPDEAPPLRPHPGAGAGGAGPVGGFHAHRPRLPEAAAGRHELPPDALQAALPAEPG